MNRLASWFFVIILFCDATNLDDVVSASVVLHDDVDTMVASMHPYPGSVASFSQVQHRCIVPPRFLRLIIDQDSPALPAESVQTAFNLLALVKNRPISLPRREIPEELLHLRNHSLLI
jgi:hypothetical protein